VLAIPPTARTARRVERIGVGHEGSPAAQRALATAVDLVSIAGDAVAYLDVVYVDEALLPSDELDALELRSSRDSMIEWWLEALSDDAACAPVWSGPVRAPDAQDRPAAATPIRLNGHRRCVDRAGERSGNTSRCRRCRVRSPFPEDALLRSRVVSAVEAGESHPTHRSHARRPSGRREAVARKMTDGDDAGGGTRTPETRIMIPHRFWLCSAVAVLRHGMGDGSIKTWIMGSNSRLAGAAPIEAVHEGRADEVMGAPGAFVTGR
jgi:nucleotide-binding universal stress UspA family protein